MAEDKTKHYVNELSAKYYRNIKKHGKSKYASQSRK